MGKQIEEMKSHYFIFKTGAKPDNDIRFFKNNGCGYTNNMIEADLYDKKNFDYWKNRSNCHLLSSKELKSSRFPNAEYFAIDLYNLTVVGIKKLIKMARNNV